MSGYVFVLGSCVNCQRSISFHPHKVPSVRVNGKREPLCRQCAERWNELHEPVPIQPDAYEPCPEEEL